MAETKTRKRSSSKSKSSSSNGSGGSSRKSAGSSRSKSTAGKGKSSTRGSAKSGAAKSKGGSAGGGRSGSSRAKSKSSGSSKSRSGSSTKSTAKRAGGSTKSTAKRAGGTAKSKAADAAPDGRGVLEKAKGPATAAGVALLGVAGGIAAARGGGKRRSGLMPKGGLPGLGNGKVKSSLTKALPQAGKGIAHALPKPDLKGALEKVKPDGSVIDWVEENAKSLGDASYKVAEMSEDARRVRKALE
jgi:hypothetical protein